MEQEFFEGATAQEEVNIPEAEVAKEEPPVAKKKSSGLRRKVNACHRGSTYDLGNRELKQAFDNKMFRRANAFDYVRLSATAEVIKTEYALAYNIAFGMVKPGGCLEVSADFVVKAGISFDPDNVDENKIYYFK